MSCTSTDGWKKAKLKSLETNKKRIEKIIEEYYKNPKRCPNCNKVIEYCRDLIRKTFCSRSCSASVNNKGKCRNKNKHINLNCLNCGKELIRKQKYCSVTCSSDFKHKKFMLNWLDNPTSIRIINTSHRNYLLEQSGYKCQKCGWGEKNIYSNTYPLIVDHIDGNSANNDIKNLRVLCSNCDSMLPTYKGLNAGNGRYSRRVRYRLGKSY